MSSLRRIVMVRHGETEGQSSVRFHGSADVALNDEGRAQLRETARKMKTEGYLARFGPAGRTSCTGKIIANTSTFP